MLVQDFLQDIAKRFPEKVALICRGARLTFAHIEASANGLAQYLLRRCLRPGERVIVCLPNCPEAAIAVFGVSGNTGSSWSSIPP